MEKQHYEYIILTQTEKQLIDKQIQLDGDAWPKLKANYRNY